MEQQRGSYLQEPIHRIAHVPLLEVRHGRRAFGGLLPDLRSEGGDRINELKPCPFCGGNARLTIWTPTAASISCIMCGAHFNTYTEAEAIEAWNTRANDIPEPKKVVTDDTDALTPRTCHLLQHGPIAEIPTMYCWSCSECGFGWHHSIYDRQFSYCPNCGRTVER